MAVAVIPHTTNGAFALDESTVQEFKSHLRGELVRPGDASYDEARKVYNGMIDKRPALIAGCAAQGAMEIKKE